MTKKQVGEEGVYLAHISKLLFISEGSWRQELTQKLWQGAAYLPAPLGLLSLLSYRAQDHPAQGWSQPPKLGPFPLITNLENALHWDLMETFPQLRLLPLMILACVKLTHKISQDGWCLKEQNTDL